MSKRVFASDWRPALLPAGLGILWWVGVVIAAAGLGLLVWAGCPALGDRLRSAYQQKMQSIRFGIVANIVGMSLAGLAIVIPPTPPH